MYLQAAYDDIAVAICLGQLNAFGVWQAHYRFTEFPAATDLVRHFIRDEIGPELLISRLNIRSRVYPS